MLSFLIALCRVRYKIQNLHFENPGKLCPTYFYASWHHQRIPTGFWNRISFTKAISTLPQYIIFIRASTSATLYYSFRSGHPVCSSLDLHERLIKHTVPEVHRYQDSFKRTITVTHNFQLFSHLIFVLIQNSWVNVLSSSGDLLFTLSVYATIPQRHCSLRQILQWVPQNEECCEC